MINFDEELRKIFGAKYQGCTQSSDRLIEWRLKSGEVATEEELNQVGLLTIPHSTHLSVLEAVDTAKARPARIKRVWEGRDYFYDCFVTEIVKDQYVAGDIVVGDYVLVHFDDIGEQIVTAKVFKSW